MERHSKPIYGFLQYPQTGLFARHNPCMGIMQTVAMNIAAWRASYPELDGLKKIALRAGIGFGTVQRASSGDGNVTVNTLEAIAGAFHRRAIDLLSDPSAAYPPSNPPKLSCAEQPPDDERQLLVGYRAASPDVRELMLDAARRAITRRDSPMRSDSQ